MTKQQLELRSFHDVNWTSFVDQLLGCPHLLVHGFHYVMCQLSGNCMLLLCFSLIYCAELLVGWFVYRSCK